MKFTKQITSLTLITLLTLSLFTLTACGGDKAGNNTDDNAVSTPQSVSQTSDESEQGSGVNVADTVVVPDVVGMNVDEATKVLENLGLVVESIDGHLMSQDFDAGNYEPKPNGEIVNQNITAGTVVACKTVISLEYASDTIFVDCKTTDFGNTICCVYYTEGKVVIPATHKGKEINAIEYYALVSLNTHDENCNIAEVSIPADMLIINKTDEQLHFKITTY